MSQLINKLRMYAYTMAITQRTYKWLNSKRWCLGMEIVKELECAGGDCNRDLDGGSGEKAIFDEHCCEVFESTVVCDYLILAI